MVVYRVDGTKNDIVHPRVKVVGYPTLYFFPAGDRLNPIEYDGNRTAEAIVAFIQAFRIEHRGHGEGVAAAAQAHREDPATAAAGGDIDKDAAQETAAAAVGVSAVGEEERRCRSSSGAVWDGEMVSAKGQQKDVEITAEGTFSEV